MHGSKASIKTLVTGLNGMASQVKGVNIAVCPPALYLDYVKKSLTAPNVKVGAQNVAEEPLQGAFTGEVSAAMLKDIGCEFVIVGHSERRSLFGETDEQIATKVKAVLNAQMTPILCVGETLDEREAGKLEAVIARQINVVLDEVGIDAFEKVVIAYEPVWAIGTGKTATAQQAQDVHAYIRSLLNVRNADVASKVIIQYGGSVKPANAKELFSQPDIDGGLIGGASLVASDFVAICEAAGV